LPVEQRRSSAVLLALLRGKLRLDTGTSLHRGSAKRVLSARTLPIKEVVLVLDGDRGWSRRVRGRASLQSSRVPTDNGMVYLMGPFWGEFDRGDC